MLKTILKGFFLGLGLWIILLPILLYLMLPHPLVKTVTSELEEPFYTTCRIQCGGSCTGVLLKSGYILTAAHCIDSHGAKNITVEFLTPRREVYKATVAFMGDQEICDFAFLEIKDPPKSNIELSKTKPLLGEEIFTIGFPDSIGPHITDGYISGRDKRKYIASSTVFFGNSGGGIWSKETDEVLGIVTRLPGARSRVPFNLMIPIPTSPGVITTVHVRGNTTVSIPRSNIVIYEPAFRMRRILESKNLLTLVDGHEEFDPGFNPHYAIMMFQILGVLYGAYFVRKHMLC